MRSHLGALSGRRHWSPSSTASIGGECDFNEPRHALKPLPDGPSYPAPWHGAGTKAPEPTIAAAPEALHRTLPTVPGGQIYGSRNHSLDVRTNGSSYVSVRDFHVIVVERAEVDPLVPRRVTQSRYDADASPFLSWPHRGFVHPRTSEPWSHTARCALRYPWPESKGESYSSHSQL